MLKRFNNLQGMTLVELAISLLLGAVLVSATVSSIMSTNKTNQLVEAQMQLQLNSVFALSLSNYLSYPLCYFRSSDTSIHSINYRFVI